MPFLFQLWVTIFPRETKNLKIFQNIRFFKIFPLNKNKISFFLPAPEFFWCHMEVQNSHFGAKAPLLHTLQKIQFLFQFFFISADSGLLERMRAPSPSTPKPALIWIQLDSDTRYICHLMIQLGIATRPWPRILATQLILSSRIQLVS